MPQFPMLPLVIDRRHIVNISSGNSLRGGRRFVAVVQECRVAALGHLCGRMQREGCKEYYRF